MAADPSWWMRAATLDERLAALRRGGFGEATTWPGGEEGADYAAWRAGSPLDARAWSRRLRGEAVDDDELARALGLPAGASEAWVDVVTRAYPAPLILPAHDDANTRTFQTILAALAPLGREAWARLRARLAGLPDLEALLDASFASLAPQLVALAGPTFTLELNCFALGEGAMIVDGQARFGEFFRRFAAGGARDFFAEYPLLARRLVGAFDNAAAQLGELIERLAADRPLLIERGLLPVDAGALTVLDPGRSDRHRGGRSVAVLEFASGARLVYKPRSLAVEAHYFELLDWMNRRGLSPAQRVVGVLDRGTHGWMEHVAAAPCAGADGLHRFFLRSGQNLALLHVLGGIDMHAENLIAAGEDPVLVDLECLFHLRPELGNADDAASVLADSVLATALLPTSFWADEAGQGVDLSGLGSAEGQMTPYPLRFWENQGTSELRVVKRPVAIESQRHRATLAGEHAAVDLPALRAGFETTYRLLLAHRDELAGRIESFADDPVRFIARGTLTYARLIEESHHPDLLRDGMAQARFFDHLWLAESPVLARLVGHERRELSVCDVPFFTTRPGSRHLWAEGGTCLFDFAGESGLARARRRIAGLGERELARQLWIVDAAFAARRPVEAAAGPASTSAPAVARRADLLGAACRIGDRLADAAVERDGRAEWLTLVAHGPGFVVAPAGLDLYGGLPGIALFLAQLGELSGVARHRALARRAVASLIDWEIRVADQVTAIGLHEGWAGLVHAYTQLARLWDDPRLQRRAEAALARVDEHLDADARHDVVGGAAGAILAVLACAPYEHGLLLRLAEHLAPHAPARLGFAHGAAGVGTALVRAGERLGHAALIAAGETQLARAFAGLDEGGVAWCHGAGGIGLAALLTGHRDVLARAAEVTLARGFGDDHSLCHGQLGNLELVVRAARSLGDASMAERATRATRALLASRLACGTPARVEVPGLMTGLAGLGWGLLRLAAPEQVPSLLAMENLPVERAQRRAAAP